MSFMLLLAIVAGALAVLYGVVQTMSLMRASPGNARMQEIAAAIQEGAQAYLQKQYTTIAIVGVVVLTITGEGFLIDNVAVHPSRRGTGLGRALLQFAEAEAEARRAGFDALHLYTHEQMTENLALYSRIGYVEYDRRSQGAFSLVYMRKQLG